MLELDRKWGTLFAEGPETGMGYTIVTVVLVDGRSFERVVVDSGVVVEVDGSPSVPFTNEDIRDIILTQDKSRYRERRGRPE
jgi:hypothetical protein